MPEHDKRVALVTGVNKGIGYAICRQLAQKGITVILAARDQTKIFEIQGKIIKYCNFVYNENLY